VSEKKLTHPVVEKVVQTFYLAFEEKNVPLLKTVVTADWQYIPSISAVAQCRGADQMHDIFNHLGRALPDMKISIVDMLIQDKKVGIRAQVSGTQSGQLFGVAASSRQVHFAIHSFHEMRGEQVAKTWHLEDWLSVFQQIGQFPPDA
jgi:steroid delta-isomerase-like uncharacterized protein